MMNMRTNNEEMRVKRKFMWEKNSLLVGRIRYHSNVADHSVLHAMGNNPKTFHQLTTVEYHTGETKQTQYFFLKDRSQFNQYIHTGKNGYINQNFVVAVYINRNPTHLF